MNPLVHVLQVSHRHGLNTYLHTTEEGVRAALVAYCKEWWEERADQNQVLTDLDDDGIITAYFHEHPSEFYNLDTVELITP